MQKKRVQPRQTICASYMIVEFLYSSRLGAMFRRIFCFALVALVTAPVVEAGGSYSRDSVMNVQNGTPVFSDAHVYVVRVETGDRVSAVISWSDPSSDLDLQVREPTPPCPVFPQPQVDCIAQGLDPTCERASGRVGLGPASEDISFVAARSGDHEIVVRTGFSTASRLPYHIDITVEGAGGAVTGPFAAIFVTNNPVCKTQLE